jgi:hypothetical protein
MGVRVISKESRWISMGVRVVSKESRLVSMGFLFIAGEEAVSYWVRACCSKRVGY